MSRFLLDTHLLLWVADDHPRLPALVADAMAGASRSLVFSVVSIWELAIKNSLRKPGFRADPRRLRDGMLAAGCEELQVTADHAIAVRDLPWLHRDPFDRLLMAQATVEGLMLLTSDSTLARYPGPVRLVT